MQNTSDSAGDVTIKSQGFCSTERITVIKFQVNDHRLRQPCVNGHWLCQWEMAIFDPPQNRHPSTITKQFVTGGYVGDPYGFTKLGAYPSTGDFWAHG